MDELIVGRLQIFSAVIEVTEEQVANATEEFLLEMERNLKDIINKHISDDNYSTDEYTITYNTMSLDSNHLSGVAHYTMSAEVKRITNKVQAQ